MEREVLEVHDALKNLVDRAAITDLVNGLGLCCDEKRYGELGGIVSEDVVWVLALEGERRVVEGLAAMKDGVLAQGLSKYSHTTHMITNIIIDLDGDTANVRAIFEATHVYADDPQKVFILRGTYDMVAVRTADGWRLSNVQVNPIHHEGTFPGST